MEPSRILILGVGNILLRDEGVGVRVVERLEQEYVFSPGVELMDGGTLGLKLLEPISRADRLIVVDAVLNHSPPGTLHRLEGEDLRKSLAFKSSLHQVDLVETLAYSEILGKRPRTVVVGVEPEDMSSWGTELTETVAARLPELVAAVVREVEAAGGACRRLEAGK